MSDAKIVVNGIVTVEMSKMMKDCPTTCALSVKGRGFAPAEGTGSNGVLLLGEALGATEEWKSQPFVGEAGYQLNFTLERTKFDRSEFVIFNTVNCRPPNNWLEGAPWEDGAIQSCTHTHLRKVLEQFNPKVIVPMGNIPNKAVMQTSIGIMRTRGYVYRMPVLGGEYWVVPTFHPSFVMRGTAKSKRTGTPQIPPFALTGVNIFDIRRAVRTAKDGYFEPTVNYLLDPAERDMEGFIKDAWNAASRGRWLACDIETPSSGNVTEDDYGEVIDSTILRISFSFQKEYAVTMPWTNRYYPFIQRLLDVPFERVVFWNADFDVPRLHSKGMRIGPPVLDAMWMWHFLQPDLPKGLGFVAPFFTEVTEWKSTSSIYPLQYSCKDSDVTIQCADAIRDQLEKEGRFERFVRSVVELDPRLKIMGNKGMKVNEVYREEFKKQIENDIETVDQRIQEVVPLNLKPCKVYKRVPADAILGGTYRGGVWIANKEGTVNTLVFPFLPSSSKQMIRYMRAMGHPVPQSHKTKRDTSDEDAIESLAKQYPGDLLYQSCIEARKLQKIKGQYIDGYEPGPDGKIRTHFGFAPATGRLSSFDPNVQNVIKRGKYAKGYRKQFVAEDGNVLVEFDYKAVEAVLLGKDAGDDSYVKAAQLGVHAILGSHVLAQQGQMEEPIDPTGDPVEIRNKVRWIKKEQDKVYDDCKHVVHLSGYGGTPFRMHMEYPESFPTLKSAKEMQDLFFATIGKGVRQWQQRTLEEAHRKCYLETKFRARRYFWRVYVWNSKKRRLEPSSIAKDVLNFKPQNMAAEVIKESILLLPEDLMRMLHWQIHDALLFEFPREKAPQLIPRVREIMERPIPELDGLKLEVEVTWGKNWGEMSEYTLPS